MFIGGAWKTINNLGYEKYWCRVKHQEWVELFLKENCKF
jgi:hypothetical protein